MDYEDYLGMWKTFFKWVSVVPLIFGMALMIAAIVVFLMSLMGSAAVLSVGLGLTCAGLFAAGCIFAIPSAVVYPKLSSQIANREPSTTTTEPRILELEEQPLVLSDQEKKTIKKIKENFPLKVHTITEKDRENILGRKSTAETYKTFKIEPELPEKYICPISKALIEVPVKITYHITTGEQTRYFNYEHWLLYAKEREKSNQDIIDPVSRQEVTLVEIPTAPLSQDWIDYKKQYDELVNAAPGDKNPTLVEPEEIINITSQIETPENTR